MSFAHLPLISGRRKPGAGHVFPEKKEAPGKKHKEILGQIHWGEPLGVVLGTPGMMLSSGMGASGSSPRPLASTSPSLMDVRERGQPILALLTLEMDLGLENVLA